MGFVSFAGRVLFASVFLLSAYQEFIELGSDGGPAGKTLRPKFNLFTKRVASHLGLVAPYVNMKHVIASTIALKGLGGLLFIFSSSFGAYLLDFKVKTVIGSGHEANDFYMLDCPPVSAVMTYNITSSL